MRSLLQLFFACCFLTGLGAQVHTIDIHPNNRAASLLMSVEEYNNWISNDEFNNQDIREALFQDIYQKFDDQYDFIFLILNEDVKPGLLPFGQLLQVSNDISGIGLGMFDSSENYGSDGKLKAVMHLTRRDYLRAGPSLHELMHNWGNFGIPTESVSAPGDGLMSFPYRPHWGFTGGSNKGQIGGFDQNTLVDNGGGMYTVGSFGPNANGGNSVPYNELELYLMGMLPSSGVSNFDVFSDITSLTVIGDEFDFEASTRTTYTPTSLETLLGERVPGVGSSQRDFKALIVVLTDAPLTTEQWNQVDDDAEKFSRTASDGAFSYNFWEATNQLGTINFEIDCSATSTDDRVECDSLVWIDGITYRSNNNTATHTITGGAANGCDSIITLDLTILNHASGTDITTACDTFTWIDGNAYTSNNNTATHTISGGATNGCDSIVTLDLTIINSSSGIDIQTACDAFTWIDGITYTSSNNTATHTLTGGAANSCDSLVMLDLTIIDIDTGITVAGPEITANMSGATYRWLKCDPGAGYIVIDGETSQSYTALSSGSYAVELTQEFCSDTSQCVHIIISSVAQSSDVEKLSIHPNPSNDIITITMESNHVYIENVSLHNSIGQEVFRHKAAEGQQVLSHDVSNYSPGIYFVQVKNSIGQISIKKLIVN